MTSLRPTSLLAILLLLAWPRGLAAQQLFGRSERATGENYHVEFGAGLWNPTPEIVVSSEALGIAGTSIDFVSDLGILKKRFPEFRLVLRPAAKHKFRLSYIPIEYVVSKTLSREIVFNGQRYRIGLPVDASLTWRSWRLGYEYDAVYRDRGFLGVVVEAKYADVSVALDSPLLSEFAQARAPIPAIGGIGRVYVTPNISITGEITGFAVPDIDEDYDGKYVDYDFYGTVNFTDHFGGQIGYRRIDVSYLFEQDAGDLKMGGLYFMGVLRY